MNEILRTTPSEVVWLAARGDEQRDYQSGKWAALGIKRHTRILAATLRARNLTLWETGQEETLVSSVAGQVEAEVDRQKMCGDTLVTGTLDAVVGGRQVVEIKPGGPWNFKRRYPLQLMLNCMVGEFEDGLLYTYGGKGFYYHLRGGGEKLWMQGERICRLGARIVQGQERLKGRRDHERYKRKTGQRGMRVFEQEVEWSADLVDQRQLVDWGSEFYPLCEQVSVALLGWLSAVE